MKEDKKELTVTLNHNPNTGNFFITFSNEDGNIISQKVTEGQCSTLSNELGIKILIN